MSEELLTSRDNELEIVKTAYYIEKTVQDLKSDYRQLTRNPYNRPREPREPVLQEVKPLQPNYPVISPPEELFKESREAIRREKIAIYVGLGIITAFFPLFLFALIPILNRIWKHYEQRSANEETPIYEAYVNGIKSTDEYIESCKKADEQCKEDYEQRKIAAQQEYDKKLKQYKEAKREYDEHLLPDYLTEKNTLSSAIENSENAIKELYENHKIIPAQYHNVPALAWIALYMHTSQFTLKDAIERWDEHVARCQRNRLIELSEAQLYVLEEQLKYQENTNWLNAQLVELSEKSNDILSSIGIWQKAYMLVNEYRYQKQKKQNKLNNNRLI